MTPTNKIKSIDCPSISHVTPAQLVSILTRWVNNESNKDHMSRYVNPIWLKNNGQNIVGIFPQKAFYLLPPPKKNQQDSINKSKKSNKTTELQLLTLTRKAVPNFSSVKMSSSRVSSSSEGINSSLTDIESSATPIDMIAGEMQLSLSTIDNIDRFIGKLIGYGEDIQAVDKDINVDDNISHNINIPDNTSIANDSKNIYTDGLMGFISYDVMANELAHILHNQHEESNLGYLQQQQPATYLGHYPIYLTCDIKNNQHYWRLHTTTANNQVILPEIKLWLTSTIKEVRPLVLRPSSMKLKAEWSFNQYQIAFKQTQKYLHAGDCYQVNLTQAWKGHLPNNSKLASYLPKLDTYTRAPFAGYLFTSNPKNQQGFELLSCSPELFLTFQKVRQDSSTNHASTNHISTNHASTNHASTNHASIINYAIKITAKPIKGTRPRGKSPEKDEQLKTELANSEKDLAENVMIVDLLRNDLGKHAKTGTVKVPKRFAIESYSNVHHMVSTVTATLKDDIHPIEVLFDSLPVGSITGTPKKRSVEIINELESEPRGAYCGTMGYMNFDGSGQWNVLIRTLQSHQQAVSLSAGGGITVASECLAEHEECLDKVGHIIDILSNM